MLSYFTFGIILSNTGCLMHTSFHSALPERKDNAKCEVFIAFLISSLKKCFIGSAPKFCIILFSLSFAKAVPFRDTQGGRRVRERIWGWQ